MFWYDVFITRCKYNNRGLGIQVILKKNGRLSPPHLEITMSQVIFYLLPLHIVYNRVIFSAKAVTNTRMVISAWYAIKYANKPPTVNVFANVVCVVVPIIYLLLLNRFVKSC
jgi:hypothetical protein